MKKEIIIKVILTTTIILASLCFTAYGILLVTSKGASNIIIIFGLSSLLYGSLSIIHLISIYLKRKIIPIKAINYIGSLFLVTFILASLDVGRISGLEWLGIFIVAILVFAISLSFKRLGASDHVA